MCKKLLIAVIAIAVGVGVVSGTRLGSHLRLKWNKAQHWAQEQVPLETEIERLRMELSQLDREDDRYYDQVARQKREVKKLRDKVNADRAALAKLEAEIRSMRQALADDTQFVVYNGSRYDRKKVEEQVRLDVRKFLADEKAVKADEETLQILEETLALNKAKLDDLGLQRKEMALRLQNLEKELAQERLHAQSKLVLDGSAYGKLKKEIEELENRVEDLRTKRELRGESTRGPIRAAEERKAEEAKIDQAADERFGKIDSKKVVGK